MFYEYYVSNSLSLPASLPCTPSPCYYSLLATHHPPSTVHSIYLSAPFPNASRLTYLNYFPPSTPPFHTYLPTYPAYHTSPFLHPSRNPNNPPVRPPVRRSRSRFTRTLAFALALHSVAFRFGHHRVSGAQTRGGAPCLSFVFLRCFREENRVGGCGEKERKGKGLRYFWLSGMGWEGIDIDIHFTVKKASVFWKRQSTVKDDEHNCSKARTFNVHS